MTDIANIAKDFIRKYEAKCANEALPEQVRVADPSEFRFLPDTICCGGCNRPRKLVHFESMLCVQCHALPRSEESVIGADHILTTVEGDGYIYFVCPSKPEVELRSFDVPKRCPTCGMRDPIKLGAAEGAEESNYRGSCLVVTR